MSDYVRPQEPETESYRAKQNELLAQTKELYQIFRDVLAADRATSATQIKTAAQVRADFERKGISIAQWAREHGVNRQLVYEILGGNERRRCTRGQSHRVAVLLGLKEGELPDRGTAAMNAIPARVAS